MGHQGTQRIAKECHVLNSLDSLVKEIFIILHGSIRDTMDRKKYAIVDNRYDKQFPVISQFENKKLKEDTRMFIKTMIKLARRQ